MEVLAYFLTYRVRLVLAFRFQSRRACCRGNLDAALVSYRELAAQVVIMCSSVCVWCEGEGRAMASARRCSIKYEGDQ